MLISYNSEKYIKEAIESVLKQTYKNFELIVVDGGSTDKTLEIVKGLKSRENRLKLIINTPDYGVGHARYVGMKNCCGSYLAFIDSDDVWEPLKLEKQMCFLIVHKHKAVATLSTIINKNGLETGIYPTKEKVYNLKNYLWARGIVTSSLLFSIEELDMGLFTPLIGQKNAEDLYLIFVLMRTFSDIFILPEVLTSYRDHAESNSKKKLKHYFAVFKISWKFHPGFLGLCKIVMGGIFYFLISKRYGTKNNFGKNK